MGKLKINHYVVGPVQTNCYFAINEDTKELIIIDPGDAAKQLAERIRKEGCKPVAILLTHGHFDHASAAEELAKEFGISIYIDEDDKETLEDPEANVSYMMGESKVFHADVFLKDEQELDLAGFHIRVLHTPGHTKGGCCYYFEEDGILIAGDTLFEESVGRIDFPGGSASELIHSIREKLFLLPDDTKVYPGHGEATTIGHEKEYNPCV